MAATAGALGTVGALASPWTLGLSLGLTGLGAFLGRNKPGLQQLPPPNPLFPGANAGYQNAIFNKDIFGASQGVGPQSISALGNILSTQGAPVDFSKLFSSTVVGGQRLQDIGRSNLKEQYGSQGLFHGTGMRDAAVSYETQSTKDLAQILAQLAYSSNESAMQRYMAAIGQGSSMYNELGTAFTPSAAVTTGNQSGAGAGAGAIGNSLQTLSLLAMMGMLGR